MTDFGKGPTLKEASPWLRDSAARIEQILAVTEINSVLEGLPPFQDETRARIRRRHTDLCVPSPRPEKQSRPCERSLS
jgi:hypothetical protein